MYQCSYCDEPVFDNWITLALHRYEEHKHHYDNMDDRVECELCDYEYKPHGIKPHFHESHQEKFEQAKEELLDRANFVCRRCDKPQTFTTEQYYNRHLSDCHPDYYRQKQVEQEKAKDYYCEGCQKGYKQKNWYQRHMREEHPNRWNKKKNQEALEHDFVCKICEPWQGFDGEVGLNIHMERLHKDKFHKKKTMEALQEEYICPFCNPVEGFDTASGYALHLNKMHPDELMFSCFLVAKSFEHKCEQCDEIVAYPEEQQLHQHQGMKHGTSKITKECPYCGDEFKVKPSLVGKRVSCGKYECNSKRQSEAIRLDPDKYVSDLTFGRNWGNQREKAIQRDNEKCQRCGMTREQHKEEYGRDLDVDHLVPRRICKERYGNNFWKKANKLVNLKTLCRECHGHIDKKKEY